MTSENKQAPASAGALPMTDAEFRCLRQWLGLTHAWIAERIGVDERQVRRWEAGTARVPKGVADQLLDWSEQTYQMMDAAVARLLDATDPVIRTYRSDADYLAAEPDAGWPASWHRGLCARIADEVPGLRIIY